MSQDGSDAAFHTSQTRLTSSNKSPSITCREGVCGSVWSTQCHVAAAFEEQAGLEVHLWHGGSCRQQLLLNGRKRRGSARPARVFQFKRNRQRCACHQKEARCLRQLPHAQHVTGDEGLRCPVLAPDALRHSTWRDQQDDLGRGRHNSAYHCTDT